MKTKIKYSNAINQPVNCHASSTDTIPTHQDIFNLIASIHAENDIQRVMNTSGRKWRNPREASLRDSQTCPRCPSQVFANCFSCHPFSHQVTGRALRSPVSLLRLLIPSLRLCPAMALLWLPLRTSQEPVVRVLRTWITSYWGDISFTTTQRYPGNLPTCLFMQESQPTLLETERDLKLVTKH